ncbi:MAG: Bax inhibitor-1/YccA family protein [Sphingomonadales bacterium]|jgi:FtsH-binding integral membrane protein
MANSFDPRATAFTGTTVSADYDVGLRKYMLGIYNYMASGVLLTGIVALLVASSPTLFSLFFAENAAGRVGPTLLGWVAMLSPLALVLVMNFGINRLSEGAVKATYWAYVALMGVSMATIFTRYTGASVAQTFFITAASFAGLSLWGYTTKKDLSGMGKFFMMALIGIIIAMVANIFIGSTGLQLMINIGGVLLFAGLTAYDTQRLTAMYYQLQGSEFVGKASVLGALTLYLNFVNLFTFLLQLVGDRR